MYYNMEEEQVNMIEEIKKKIPDGVIEQLKSLGIDINDEDKFLLVLGVALGILQIAKRGDKYYIRVAPPQNLPKDLFEDIYPEKTKEVLEINSYLAKVGRGNPYFIKEKWEEIKAKGLWTKEEKLLTEEQKQKLVDRLNRILPFVFE